MIIPFLWVVSPVLGSTRPRIEIGTPWQVRICTGTVIAGGTRYDITSPAVLDIPPPAKAAVKDERIDTLPLLDEQAAPWTRGVRLKELVTFETTAPDMLEPGSVVLKAKPGSGAPYKPGVDYALEARWGTVARLPAGKIAAEAPAYVDYTAGQCRIDSIVVHRDGSLSLAVGTPHVATPMPPTVTPGDVVLANVWVPGRLPALTDENLFPVDEPTYRPPRRTTPLAQTRLSRTWRKLLSGDTVHVMAWGDSVTAGGQASDVAHRYQDVFVGMLRTRFPHARIDLTTVGWGGRSSDDFLKEPPSSEYNFERAVLRPRPDLVVMEFVNDAWMPPDVVERKYSYLQARLREVGAEWVIITPHFVRPDWMGANTVKVEADPRPYVAGLRAFAVKHGVVLADASARWSHLVKEGIPYVTLLSNAINHPDDRGHRMFAEALMEVFGGSSPLRR